MNRLITIVSIIVLSFSLTACTPEVVKGWNTYTYSLQKANDETNYRTLKKVEDTCRSMMASYDADMLTYEQYKDSDNEEKQEWAEQAKMRANKTASTYNNYILENSFVWADGVPEDIKNELEYIE